LGNLTLLTRGLNSAVSNGPWDLKRAKVAQHDVFLMNRLFQDPATETWDEEHINARSQVMIDALLATWPVPEGHTGAVQDAGTKDQMSWVELKHLVGAGLLQPGSRLIPRAGQWASTDAVVRADGMLDVDGKTFATPSGAGKHVKGGITNGWHFWRLEDGRRLADVRAAYRGTRPASEVKKAAFDWSGLHAILEGLPDGSWTTYGDLADVVGTAAQPLGAHIMNCGQCANAHRVLTNDGRVAEAFKWGDPNDRRDPAALLVAQGLRLEDGRADPEGRLTSAELTALVSRS
jgi:alkylated DNA nucleotide flippase Atl1